MNLLFWLMMLGTVVVVYLFWVRPLLKKNPALKDLFAAEDTVREAMCAKFSGIKQRLAHALIIMATAVVAVHDKLAPAITGIDTSPFMAKINVYVPDWGWPLIMIAGVSLLDYFRKIADKEMDAKVAEIAAAPEPPKVPNV